MEVSLETRAQLAEARTEARPVLPTLPDPPPRGAGASVVPRPSAVTAVPDTLLSPVYEPPPRSRWLWFLVAVVAAAVGVVIGAIAGTR